MKEYFLKLASYNLTSNRKMLSNLNAKYWDTEVVSSFSSVKQTVLHIWDAEMIWLNRLQKISFKSWPSDSFEGDIQVLVQNLLDSSKQLEQFIESKEEEFFNKTIQYKTLNGVDFKNTAAEMISHCINHSTYHRGQLVTILRQLGEKDIANTDLISYYRNKF